MTTTSPSSLLSNAAATTHAPQSLCPPCLPTLTRAQLLRYFENTWRMGEWLFSSIVDPAGFYTTADPLRHPMIFYWGHTAAFYLNKLNIAELTHHQMDAWFEDVFAQGVDPETPADMEARNDWPHLDRVNAYRDKLYGFIRDFIQKVDLPKNGITEKHPLWALMMGLEHDRIHFETSSALIRQLPVELLQRPAGWRYAPTTGQVPATQMIRVSHGKVVLGRSDHQIFGWDNEYGRQELEVPAFEADRNLVTNGAYLEFVQSGAYADPQYWSQEALVWKSIMSPRHPRFWVPHGDTFQYRAMFDIINLPLSWPVVVNAHEAEAFCRWKGDGFRLLNEGEFRRITATLGDHVDPAFTQDFNLNMRYGSECPVGSLRSASSPAGFNDVYGNVWTWLRNDFVPLPGFAVHPYYQDFSTPFFDDRHAMMLGGSWATMGTSASRNYRLWFRRHFVQHAGFRLARDLG